MVSLSYSLGGPVPFQRTLANKLLQSPTEQWVVDARGEQREVDPANAPWKTKVDDLVFPITFTVGDGATSTTAGFEEMEPPTVELPTVAPLASTASLQDRTGTFRLSEYPPLTPNKKLTTRPPRSPLDRPPKHFQTPLWTRTRRPLETLPDPQPCQGESLGSSRGDFEGI